MGKTPLPGDQIGSSGKGGEDSARDRTAVASCGSIPSTTGKGASLHREGCVCHHPSSGGERAVGVDVGSKYFHRHLCVRAREHDDGISVQATDEEEERRSHLDRGRHGVPHVEHWRHQRQELVALGGRVARLRAAERLHDVRVGHRVYDAEGCTLDCDYGFPYSGSFPVVNPRRS